MKKKSGFTLIELLAVIVILAVIALIVTPVVNSIIKEAKTSADLISAEAYVKAAENYYAESKQNDSVLDTNVIDSLELDNKKAESGSSVMVYSDGTVSMAIVINGKCYKKNTKRSNSTIEVTDDVTNCNIDKYMSLYDTVIDSHPELELGDNGCNKSDSTKNYTYMGGCYLVGDITDNYLTYSGQVWRIMGINSDKSIRIITDDVTEKMSYGATTYDSSNIKTWLEGTFYDSLENKDILVDGQWCTNSITINESNSTVYDSYASCNSILTSKIASISASEYSLSNGYKYASDQNLFSSYLVNGKYFWVINASYETYNSSSNNMYVRDAGSVGHYGVSSSYVRPVVNIDGNTDVKSGDGTSSSSYQI